jgi:hypothetical protein
MADDYNIPIDVKFATTGEAEAADGFKKVAAAANDLASAGNGGMGGMLEHGNQVWEQREKANAERLAQISKEKAALEDLAKAEKKSLADEIAGMRDKESAARHYAKTLDDAADAEASSSRKKEIAGAVGAIGIAAAAAMKTLGQVKEAFESVDTVKLRNIDAEMANQIDRAKDWSTALEDPIGMLLKLTTGETVGSAFEAMNEAIENVAKQHEEAIDRLIEKGIVQKDALKKMASEIAAANEILDAKDDADGKARDRSDEKEIRDGAAPEDVKARRAKDDADLEIRKIDRDLDAKAPGVQKAYDNLQQGRKNLEAVENAPNSAKPEGQEFVKKARDRLKELQDEYDEQQLEFNTAKKVAEEKRRGVREEQAGTVEGLSGDKSDRLAKEKEVADRKAEAEKRKADAEAARAAREAQKESHDAQKDTLDGKESALDTTARSRGLNMRNFGLKNGNETAANVGKALSDGTDAAEIQKLGDQVREAANQNGAAMTAALKQVLAGLESQAAEIEKLKGQVRKGRDMK